MTRLPPILAPFRTRPVQPRLQNSSSPSTPFRDPARGTTRCVVSFHHDITMKNTSSIHKSMFLFVSFLTGSFLTEFFVRKLVVQNFVGKLPFPAIFSELVNVCLLFFIWLIATSLVYESTWQCSKQTIAQETNCQSWISWSYFFREYLAFVFETTLRCRKKIQRSLNQLRER